MTEDGLPEEDGDYERWWAKLMAASGPMPDKFAKGGQFRPLRPRKEVFEKMVKETADDQD